MTSIPFLSAEWRNLLVINYLVNPEVLAPLVPPGTELDDYQSQHFVSLVGFMFRRNRFLGVIPTFPNVNFEEANLRFYVKRNVKGEIRKGVAFIREVVPSKFIAAIARRFYNEPYVALPMAHSWSADQIGYSWRSDKELCAVRARIKAEPLALQVNSFPHFILEHYWGYTSQRDGSTVEYQVEHPPWMYHDASFVEVSPSVQSFYGKTFAQTLAETPHSSFVALGSDIKVSWPRKF